MKPQNIAIIGAGPIGCYAGYLLSKAGHHVSIYENHPQVGLPIQCTGLLTHDFDQFNLRPESFLINTLTTIQIHSQNKTTQIPQKEYLVCRKKFDNFFANLAQLHGATLYLSHSFEKKENNTLIIKDTKNNKEIRITPDIVIASDGPLSVTSKAYNLYHPNRKNFYGVQATVKGTFNKDTYQAHFSPKICPGLFAWIVPESATTARVGIGTEKDSRIYFEKFMKQQHFIASEMQAGTIPIYEPKQKLFKDNCYPLGDAAGFVKATTLGGLIPGLTQAKILTEAFNNNKNTTINQVNKQYLRTIQPLRRRLRIHLLLHNMFNKFEDKDWDKLIKYMSQPRIQKILTKHTRENPIPILTKTLIKEPRFLYFAKFLLK